MRKSARPATYGLMAEFDNPTDAVAAARRVRAADHALGIALTGGVFRHPGRLLREATLATVAGGAPLAREVIPELEPVAGALLLAFDAAGIEVAGEVEQRLRATLPAAALYETHPAAMSAAGD
jgi:hypothetical protein